MRKFMERLARNFARNREQPVASLSVQAGRYALQPSELQPFRVLRQHLFRTLLDSDAADVSSASSARILHAAALTALPPVLLTLALIGAYSGLMPFRQLRPYRLQAQDHFLYVCYAFSIGGMVALLKWEAFFPSLLDVRVLGLLPISNRRLFAAKALASGGFLLLFAACANGPAALFLPSIAGDASFPRHLAAHVVATGAAATFAMTASFSVMALVDLLCTARVQSVVAPVLQSGLIALYLLMLLVSPLLAPLASARSVLPPGVVLAVPPIWFTGLYEWVQGVAPHAQHYGGLAHVAGWATLASAVALVVLYPLSYHRRVRRLMEGPPTLVVRTHLLGRLVPGAVLARCLPSAAHRAAFHFVGQTIFRVQRFRIAISVALSAGVALAVLLTNALSGAFMQPGTLLTGIAGLSATTLAGLSLVLSSAQEPQAGWVFRVIHDVPERPFLEGMRRWVLGFTLLLSLLIGTGAMLAVHAAPAILLRVAISICAWNYLCATVLFAPFRDVPWTAQRSKRVHVLFHAICLFGIFPTLLTFFTLARTRLANQWPAVLVMLAVTWGIRAAVSRWYQHLDLARYTVDEDEGMQRLHLLRDL